MAERADKKQSEADLSDSKKSIETTDRTKSQFLKNMQHELRTPLTNIIGYTEILSSKEYGNLNENQEEFIQIVYDNSQHLLYLINDVLNFSKAGAAITDLKLSEVHLKKLLENCFLRFKEKTLKCQLKLSLDIEDVPDTIRIDESKLNQIVFHLLSNAIKFTKSGGKVRLKAKLISDFGLRISELREKEEIVLEQSDEHFKQSAIEINVSDSGIGIKREDRRRIFNQFEMVDASDTREFSGMGMGLSYAKRLVKLHQGAIWVESAGEGKGSTFFFIIPI